MDSFPKDLGLHHQRNRRIVQFVLMALLADIGLIVIELAMGLDPLEDMSQRPLVYLYVFLGILISFGIFGAMVGSREDLLASLALRDPLTGLYNARYLQMRIEEEWAASKRYETPLSYVLFDLDHFKKVNDQYGHPAGDAVLRRLGRLMEAERRVGEIAARIGGEEFALLLPHTSAEKAAVGAERIRESVHRTLFEVGEGDPVSVTVSAGVACTADHKTHTVETLYGLADRALYRAKETGRNRVVTALRDTG